MTDNTVSTEELVKELIGGEEEVKTDTDESKPSTGDTELTVDKNTLLSSTSLDSHDKWSLTLMNKNQLSIIQYALLNSQLHIPYFVPYDWSQQKEKENKERDKTGNRDNAQAGTEKFLRQTYMFGYNELSSEFHRNYINATYLIAKTIGYQDLGVMVNSLLDDGRQLFVNNQYRSILHQILYAQRTLTKDDEKELDKGFVRMDDIGYVLSKIRNPPLTNHPKDLDEINAINARAMFAPFAAYLIRHNIFTPYIKTKDIVELAKHIPINTIDKFKIVKISKELQAMFNKTHKYFDELKKILKYNEQQGFYVYVQDGVELPILCIHEYMILSGRPLSEVSIKCYLDGNCKYCGAEMNAYHEVAKQELPVKVYDLIYKFMSCLNENVDESLMMFAIFDLVYNSVKKNVDAANPTNYDESVVAFSGLYLYALYLTTRDRIAYSPTKFNKFLDSAKKYWTEIGWSTRNVEQAINSSIFNDMRENDNALNILKQYVYGNKITFLDVLPLSILFTDVVDPADVPKLKASNKIQELFLTNKMVDFNTSIDKAYLKLWKLTANKEFINKYPVVKYKSEIVDIKVTKPNYGEKFFTSCCLSYCPVNGYHEFSGDVCKHCKLKKDKSNAKQIYLDNADTINNSYLQEPQLLPSKKLSIQPLYSISEIEQMKAEELYEKYIKIDSYVLKQAIDKAITDLTNFDELKVLIKTLLSINANDVKKDAKFIKQCLCFIVSNNIRSSESIISELENIYFKIDNIDWLTV